MQERLNRTIPVRCALVLLVSFAVYYCQKTRRRSPPSSRMMPELSIKGQVVTETYGGTTMLKGDKPAFEARNWKA